MFQRLQQWVFFVNFFFFTQFETRQCLLNTGVRSNLCMLHTLWLAPILWQQYKDRSNECWNFIFVSFSKLSDLLWIVCSRLLLVQVYSGYLFALGIKKTIWKEKRQHTSLQKGKVNLNIRSSGGRWRWFNFCRGYRMLWQLFTVQWYVIIIWRPATNFKISMHPTKANKTLQMG